LCKRMCDFIVTPPVLWMCMEDFEYCMFKQFCDVGWASTAGCSFLSAVAIALLQAGVWWLLMLAMMIIVIF